MYAIVVETYDGYGNIVPAGNKGFQKLRNKTRQGWKSETEILRRNTTGSVYIVQDYTQEMCEMSPFKLADYVQSHYITIL